MLNTIASIIMAFAFIYGLCFVGLALLCARGARSVLRRRRVAQALRGYVR